MRLKYDVRHNACHRNTDFQKLNRPIEKRFYNKILGCQFALIYINYKRGKVDPPIPERNRDKYIDSFNSSRNIRLSSKQVLFRLTYNTTVITNTSLFISEEIIGLNKNY
jgi:hypothetical protein